MSAPMKQGPPYVPTTWSLGGNSKKSVDLPITAVFLVLYIIGAAAHISIFRLNRRKGHKFLFSAVLFGFCVSRIVTCSLRIASVCLPTNINLAITAAIFVAAGVLILFIVNLIWSQRILRSLHPRIGWHWMIPITFRIIYILIFSTFVVTITATVQSFFTLRPRTRKIDRALQLYAQTFLAVISCLSILIVLATLAIPRRTAHEPFGSGKLSTKIAILLMGSTLVSVGAWYRCATTWYTPVPRSHPFPTYFHKACFYIFNFGVEILTIYLYASVRVDRRFHVPDGAQGPGGYEMRIRNVPREVGEEMGEDLSTKGLQEDHTAER